MISVQNIEKRYGDMRAVSQLSFEIKQGEIVGLLGHNGAGKTTLMKMITGYIEPTNDGQIVIDGLDVVKNRIEVQKKIGYLPEHSPLYPELQINEYLMLMAELRGLKGNDKKLAVKRAMEETGLSHRKYDLIAHLSKGYQQRVGIAQAILHQPQILILDEPSNGLDPMQNLEIRQLIKKLSQNATIILSTHILPEIEAVCDRVLIMIQGELAKDAPIKSFLSSSSIRLKLKESKENRDVIGVLKRIDHVKTVLALPSHRDGSQEFKIVAQKDPSALLPKISQAIFEKGWELLEIYQDVQDLETAFRELMTQKANRVQITHQQQSNSTHDQLSVKQAGNQGMETSTSVSTQSNSTSRDMTQTNAQKTANASAHVNAQQPLPSSKHNHDKPSKMAGQSSKIQNKRP
jgi:ABC-2 type transport system ATP-binding protein